MPVDGWRLAVDRRGDLRSKARRPALRLPCLGGAGDASRGSGPLRYTPGVIRPTPSSRQTGRLWAGWARSREPPHPRPHPYAPCVSPYAMLRGSATLRPPCVPSAPLRGCYARGQVDLRLRFAPLRGQVTASRSTPCRGLRQISGRTPEYLERGRAYSHDDSNEDRRCPCRLTVDGWRLAAGAASSIRLLRCWRQAV